MNEDVVAHIARLPLWHGPVDPQPLGGGITNANFTVTDAGVRYFVRSGDDIPIHGILRSNELAASRAAHAAGISPEIVYHEPGIMVLHFIEGHTLAPADLRQTHVLGRALELVIRSHRDIPRYFRGPAMMFWVFQVLRDYAATLREGDSRMLPELPRLMRAAEALEKALGPVQPVFGHNDLLAANFIDDGQRLWLVDWDYAGFNSPLFDLAGLASNNELTPAQERHVLECYFEAPVTETLCYRYAAMKCASLLRESMWSMVSELHSKLDFDYIAYTAENLARFEQAWSQFQAL